MKHTISTRWLANPNWGHSHFPYNLRNLHETLFIIKVKILVLINCLTMLIVEPKMVKRKLDNSPISFEYMSFFVPILGPTLNHIPRLWLREVNKLGVATFDYNHKHYIGVWGFRIRVCMLLCWFAVWKFWVWLLAMHFQMQSNVYVCCHSSGLLGSRNYN